MYSKSNAQALRVSDLNHAGSCIDIKAISRKTRSICSTLASPQFQCLTTIFPDQTIERGR